MRAISQINKRRLIVVGLSMGVSLCLVGIRNNGTIPLVERQAQAAQALPAEYAQLAQQIADLRDNKRTQVAQERLRKEVLRQDSLIWASDRDPADVVIRRTAALLDHLSATVRLDTKRRELTSIQKRNSETPISDFTGREQLFLDAIKLRRIIAFSNPLLNFNKILFAKHDPCPRDEAHGNHMCDQYFGYNGTKGGGVYILSDPFGDSPTVQNIVENCVVESGRLMGQKLDINNGSFLSPSLSYDGKTVLFSYSERANGAPWKREWSQERSWHLFKMNIDGSSLTQLTDGEWNDIHPCFLPSGEIVFISDRRGGFGRCHGRPVPTYTLHSVKQDGSGLKTISFHETNEWHPTVDNDGKIAYTRWDYVDRDSDSAHHIWLCYPDGRDPRSLHGNYPETRELRPWMEMSIQPIPNSHKYVAVAAPHHGQAYGTLVLIDLRKEDDNEMSQVKRITPEVHFPESEVAPGVTGALHAGRASGGEVYGTPWPLSEDFYLCVYDQGQSRYGIYLVDSFGNRELLYQSNDIACLSPIPVRARTKPPVIPSMVKDDGPDTGKIAVMNIYQSKMPWPEGTEISALRIIQVFPKSTPNVDQPRIGIAAQSLARRVLGTVPVEKDGSAYFSAPANVPIYFQALDKRGMAVQTMMSDTYLHSGETMTCVGCHESKKQTALDGTKSVPIALRRAPSAIRADVTGSNPVLYPALVQPVLDKHCVSCHESHPNAPDLSNEIPGKNRWSKSYETLSKLAWFKSGGNGALRDNGSSKSTPGKVGAQASKLFRMLEKGHHGVKLPPEDLHRITLWMDCNSVFYGAYTDAGKQAKGTIVLPEIE